MRIGHLHINPWLLSNFKSTETGVDVNICISMRQCISEPFIIIARDLKSLRLSGIVISIGTKPRILWPKGKIIDHKVWQQLVLWIRLNRQALYLHWNNKISTGEFCSDFFTKI